MNPDLPHPTGSRTLGLCAAGATILLLVLHSCRATQEEPAQPSPTLPNPALPNGEDTGAERRVRFLSDRDSPVSLPLPEEEDAFFFTIFGDRTGGPAAGVSVLADAVQEVNLLKPDLVMTVGDLIEGYNQTDEWLVQMREFKGIMNRLSMPWFPVAGNHDIYWRGEGKPPGEHEGNYETHFGPLWYAFQHKNAWFIVLYTDEGDPQTGRKYFRAGGQRMSPEQLEWLSETLERTTQAEHVFVFLHHPRWYTEGYGDDWQHVHAELVRAENVTAVFAGHIHRMRYHGAVDGIEYFTLATTGGSQAGDVPRAGYLHHYHIVTVRPDEIGVVAFPVGSALDPRAITDEVSDDARSLARSLRPRFEGGLVLTADLELEGSFAVEVGNPVARPLDVTLSLRAQDPRWSLTPDHAHTRVEAGQTARFEFQAIHSSRVDDAFQGPELTLAADYLAQNLRVPLPERVAKVPIDAGALPAPPRPEDESVLVLDGQGQHLRVEHADIDLPDGPFTLEAWLYAASFAERVGFITKTESSEFGLFVSSGAPSFALHVAGSYSFARLPEHQLDLDRWQHLAGVFDGEEMRLYVDGQLIARTPAEGARTRNALPLLIGADVDSGSRGVSPFAGEIDEVRLSRVARYAGESFNPERRFEPDADTALLLHMDADSGPWIHDASPARAHAWREGGARTR